jgi:gluconolactonase
MAEHQGRREPQLFAEKLSAPEGPVVAPNGWMLNVCSFTLAERAWPFRGGDIVATHQSRPLQTHAVFSTSTAEVVGIPAALAFGPDGCLYVTDEGRRAIVRVAPDSTQTDFLTACDGVRLNGPNDLCFDPNGNLFFTDPWTSSIENPIGGVYGYDWASGVLTRIAEGLAFPNGIVAREGRLYMAETMTRKVWLYEVTGPGRAGPQVEFCTLPEMPTTDWQGGDGMALDAEGNLYVTQLAAGCLRVYDPNANLIDTIPTTGKRPTNVCFGGPNLDTLYVTVDDLGRFMTIPIGVPGYRLPFCPSRSADHPWSRLLPLAPA